MLHTIPSLSSRILEITLNLKLAMAIGLKSLITTTSWTLGMGVIILEFMLGSIHFEQKNA